jgi:hypothetical protein
MTWSLENQLQFTTATGTGILQFPSMPTNFSFCVNFAEGSRNAARKPTHWFFPEDGLPSLSLTRVTPAQIKHMFDHHRRPEWPTSFD